MENKDLTRIKHMADSAAAILTFAKGRRRTDLDKDRQFLSAVLREMEIIGEAASKVTSETRKKFPNLPWKETVGMRNRLIHAYFDVDRDVVWATIREYLPLFLGQLEEIISRFEP